MVRVGAVGTGFIVREVAHALAAAADLDLTRVLTRRPVDEVDGVDRAALTHDVDELIAASDIVFESTGDPVHATAVVEQALLAGRPVVTMDAELHVTTGTYLAGLGYLTEADGDQPGATALLRREALDMGFRPLAYVNVKGFLDPNPGREAMEHWSGLQGLSVTETTSFTDGTKLQIEQALCANAFGATLDRAGMIGGAVRDLHATDHLVAAARERGRPIADYILCPGAPPGVAVLADHDAALRHPHYGPYEKLRTAGDSAYVLVRPFHLCGLEVVKSLRAVVLGEPPLLTNGTDPPHVGVAAVAKRDLATGTLVDHGIGSFDVRGEAVIVSERPDHLPLGLLRHARLRRDVERGATVTADDVDLPESRALEIWREHLAPGRPATGRTDVVTA